MCLWRLSPGPLRYCRGDWRSNDRRPCRGTRQSRKSGSAARRAPISSSTRRTRCIGGRGGLRRSPTPSAPASRSCSRSATPPAIGATSWRMRASRTTRRRRVMNDLFVNIKVDREERPDVDAIYMAALHELGEQGGWPLTMFLTSDAEPFWGGTYFPKDARYGRPAFTHVLKEIARIYRDEQAKVRQNADDAEGAGSRRSSSRAPTRSRATRRSTISRGACSSSSIRHMAASEARRNFRNRNSSNFLWRAGLRYGQPNLDRGGDAHPHPYRARRHLRSSRRRLRPLQRGRALARAAFREDALRQRAAARADDRGLARDRRSPLFAIRVRETIDWLMREMRHRGRRLRLVARRRQRGRGGQVLCVEPGRDRGRSRRGRRQALRRDLRRDGRRATSKATLFSIESIA